MPGRMACVVNDASASRPDAETAAVLDPLLADLQPPLESILKLLGPLTG